MSDFNSKHQHADPVADARAWLAHIERKIARLAAQASTPLKDDQQFEDRLRIAERLVRDLREAGYSCELADGSHVALTHE